MKAILFDFDGTLIDSAPDHLRAYRASLAHYGIDLTPERYFATYSPNWHQMYAALGLPQTAWEEADAAWLAEVANHESPLFPGVVPLLSNLGQRSTLGLVTAGSRRRVMQQLQRTGIRDSFDVIITHEDVQRRKPDPDGLLQALATLRITPDEAVYVGDAREDCQMAQSAGVAFVGVAGELATIRLTDCPQIATIADLPAFLVTQGWDRS